MISISDFYNLDQEGIYLEGIIIKTTLWISVKSPILEVVIYDYTSIIDRYQLTYSKTG
jgi:hypothetical protein